jgi:Tfp pilus assembly protein PilZ
LPQNRRSATRHEVSLDTTLKIGEQEHARTLTNLSLGGAFVEHDERIPIGTRVTLEFRIPNREQPVAIGAEVRWAAESGAGVQFDGLRAGEVWSLNQFLGSFSSSD